MDFGYGAEAIVDRVDWAIPRGGSIALSGAAAAARTTLLKLAAGLLAPRRGVVRIDGVALDGPGPRIGFVFQQPTLLDWLSVLDNVLLPLSLKRSVGEADRETARALLDRVACRPSRPRHPAQLSGGQQSRVAVARALITQPACCCWTSLSPRSTR